MKQKVYIVTSVIGGYHDDEFSEVTRQFFERNSLALVCNEYHK